ncbi:hypothetical protein FOZ62_001200 [Perkinsus olseni]|uniref:Uncharacterized protein n=1 Tax=Perkinsus olseni TaxID=32597 RepID=A0A7J6PX80_PEROL|nr:hypothetical protein FOZ62_001200 [Perkinsus olseni]
MGVSAEGRFVLLWLAASILGRPLLLWDRIEELKQSSMRIDVEEVRASLARVVNACQLKGIVAKQVFGYLLDYGLETSQDEHLSHGSKAGHVNVLRGLYSTIAAGV